MPIIDTLDNLSLLAKKRSIFKRVSSMPLVSKFKMKGCMPTSEQMKESFAANVTHLKIK